MENNVALDSTKKRKFLKSIKSLKKLIKKNEKGVVEKPLEEKKKRPKRVKPDRGLVYLSHIPHGFYEHQMTEYFKQFGGVTNARVIRSRRTGRSKGFAFVEFREPAVAQIVAETMNNYLMGKRLIKAAYIPPEKIRRFALRKNWNDVYHPAAVERTKQKKSFNAVKSDSEELKKARKMLSNLEKTKKKLSEFGINYDFMPVDIPLELIKIKQEREENENTVKEETDVKPTKKEKKKGERKQW
ncbi:MKI67 FHA domain-interacting nucleolar phosphoprotein-like [Manduca sexta]|uniref:MKI67 FHA domain-interacting nucleolar phosphoprotein-like n=1 Tax=Manduca sexta TaxID=7130 RepID=UPI00188FE0AA|nr:MKI67 FHA domain-interacting nucleolar phosphoprotein-like [Manduca sexta]